MGNLRIEQTATGINLAAYDSAGAAVDLTVDGVAPGAGGGTTPIVGSRLRSSNQTVTTGTTTQVLLNAAYGPTTSTADYTMLAFASSQFTVAEAGWYSVVGSVSWTNDATLTGARYTYVRVNSTDALWKAEVPTPGTFPQTVAGLVFANAGDTISLWCRHTRGSNLDVVGAADKLTYLDVSKA